MTRLRMFMGSTLALCVGGLALVVARNGDAPKAEAPPKTAANKIVQVTVYPNSALVTREVDVPQGEGSMELVVNPLPEHTVTSSLYSEGAEGIRVLTTRFRTRPVKEDTREDVRKLEDEARKLKQTQEQMQAEAETLKQNMLLLGKLEGFTTVSTTHATEKGKLDSDATIALAKYVMDGRAEKSKEVIKLQQQLQSNVEQMEFVARKLRDLTAGSSKTERDAVIVVDKVNNAPGKIRLNYLVDSAAWHPQYKFRAGKDGKEGVQLEYLAAIIQQTGEDWNGVKVILSTAQPMLNAAPPDLKMLAVNVVPRGSPVASQPRVPNPPGQALGPNSIANQPLAPIVNPEGINTAKELEDTAKQYRAQAQEHLNKKQIMAGNDGLNYAGALDQARDLVLVASESDKGKGVHRAAKNEGPTVTYHLSSKLTVPSRNDEQVLEVTRIDLTPEYFYKAVPVLTPHVYRQANITNKSKYVLLPGEATMYNGSDFVGRMNLPLVAIGETFTVGFGAEPQLQVQRQMMEKSRTMQGGNQILKYEYRLLVNSFKTDKVKLQLWDRLPIAENETMGVTLVKATPEVSTDAIYQREERPGNLLRWDLEIDPEMNGEKARTVKYEFKLELDRQMNIGSFQSK